MKITYEYTIAIVVIAVVFWTGLIIYRVGREKVIKNVDFWRSKWKIVMFWFIILAVIALALYVINHFNLWPYLKKE